MAGTLEMPKVPDPFHCSQCGNKEVEIPHWNGAVFQCERCQAVEDAHVFLAESTEDTDPKTVAAIQGIIANAPPLVRGAPDSGLIHYAGGTATRAQALAMATAQASTSIGALPAAN